MNVNCPYCGSGEIEEVDIPCNGNVEYECQRCVAHFWSDELDEAQ